MWIDGPLVSAVKKGHWIFLEDANRCSPAVLDRLNPLLEGKHSYLLLNEATGRMQRLKPHKHFRLIMAWDPKAGGDISRAMRNRGVEIFYNPSHRSVHHAMRGAIKGSGFLDGFLDSANRPFPPPHTREGVSTSAARAVVLCLTKNGLSLGGMPAAVFRVLTALASLPLHKRKGGGGEGGEGGEEREGEGGEGEEEGEGEGGEGREVVLETFLGAFRACTCAGV